MFIGSVTEASCCLTMEAATPPIWRKRWTGTKTENVKQKTQEEILFSFYFFSSPNCRYRITIGNKTCVFEKENDPSLLRSPSAGKLIQFTVEDGGHVFSGQCYAEIEVQCLPNSEEGSYSDKQTRVVNVDSVIPGDEDGNDTHSCRVWLYSLCEEGRSSTGAWLCHCQAATGWPQQSATGNACLTKASVVFPDMLPTGCPACPVDFTFAFNKNQLKYAIFADWRWQKFWNLLISHVLSWRRSCIQVPCP